MIETRPNIAFAILLVSLFAKNPSYQYIKVVKTIPKYLKGSKYQDIIYKKKKKLKIKGYLDLN